MCAAIPHSPRAQHSLEQRQHPEPVSKRADKRWAGGQDPCRPESTAIDFRTRGRPVWPSPSTRTTLPVTAVGWRSRKRFESEEGLHRRNIDRAIPCRPLRDRARIRESGHSEQTPGHSPNALLSGPGAEGPGDSRHGPASPRNSDAERLAEGECSPAGASPPRLQTGVTGQPATLRTQRCSRDSGISAG